jgi:hypothetical protein
MTCLETRMVLNNIADKLERSCGYNIPGPR